MSRPAAAVHRVIKAYDIRGLVGEEIDDGFVAEILGEEGSRDRDHDDELPAIEADDDLL